MVRKIVAVVFSMLVTLPLLSQAADLAPTTNIVATDESAGPFKSLVASLTAAGLVGGTFKINDATVMTADVAASNGTILLIDTVLMPR